MQETHKRYGFIHCVRKIPWSRKWQLTLVFLPGKFHGQRSLAGYSPWGYKESYRTEPLNLPTPTHPHIIKKQEIAAWFTQWAQDHPVRKLEQRFVLGSLTPLYVLPQGIRQGCSGKQRLVFLPGKSSSVSDPREFIALTWELGLFASGSLHRQPSVVACDSSVMAVWCCVASSALAFCHHCQEAYSSICLYVNLGVLCCKSSPSQIFLKNTRQWKYVGRVFSSSGQGSKSNRQRITA